MAQRMQRRDQTKRSPRNIDAPVFDPDRGRGEINPDPKEPALDKKTGIETTQPTPAVLSNVRMAARPVLCHCGGRSFELIGTRWVCNQCSPQRNQQPAQRIAPREVVTMPANISAGDRAELRKAWELINKKRAVDGLAALPKITAQRQEINNYPANVTFYSLMGIEAARRGSGSGGAWRLWVLYNALDHARCNHAEEKCYGGSGHIKRNDLRTFVFSLGVNRMTWKRWYSESMRLGMFTESRSVRGDWYMVFFNAGVIGAALGCVGSIGRRVTMKAADLIGNGWKARIFAAHETTYNNKPVARETMRRKLDISKNTQRYREAIARVKKTTNIAKLNKGADYLAGVREYVSKPGAYFVDHEGVLNRRLPNSYQYENAALSQRGRGRKVTRIIRGIISSQQESSLLPTERAQSFIDADESEIPSDVIRIYNTTCEETKRSKKKIQQTGNNAVSGVFEYLRTARKSARRVYWSYVTV